MFDRGPQLVVVVGIFLGLASVAVGLRCFVQIYLTRCFGMDDGLCVVSLIFFILASLPLFIGVGIGVFGHPWTDIPPKDLRTGLKLLLLCEASYVAATTLVKISIGVFLLRFCVENLYKRIIYGVLLLISCFGTFILLFLLFQCRPPSAFWEQAISFSLHDHCDIQGAVISIYIHSSINSAADWILGILPIFIVWRMHLNLRTKVYLAIILALGSCASLATFGRIAYIRDYNDPRNLFYNYNLIIWSQLEVGVALIASSAAKFRPLLLQFKSCVRRFKSQHTSQESCGQSLAFELSPHSPGIDSITEMQMYNNC